VRYVCGALWTSSPPNGRWVTRPGAVRRCPGRARGMERTCWGGNGNGKGMGCTGRLETKNEFIKNACKLLALRPPTSLHAARWGAYGIPRIPSGRHQWYSCANKWQETIFAYLMYFPDPPVVQKGDRHTLHPLFSCRTLGDPTGEAEGILPPPVPVGGGGGVQGGAGRPAVQQGVVPRRLPPPTAVFTGCLYIGCRRAEEEWFSP